ncbi:zinc transporter permease [Acidipropionibacterium jensenii]|nr:zinc transporter permease [Acidipropionibacterium jensenii]
MSRARAQHTGPTRVGPVGADHKAVQHGDHTDYLHDDYLHALHPDHYDEH